MRERYTRGGFKISNRNYDYNHICKMEVKPKQKILESDTLLLSELLLIYELNLQG
jgi:hypothetical protein